MVAVKNSREVHIETQRLIVECTVFQAVLCGIAMAVDWIQNQRKNTFSYAIHVDSKAALLAIANMLSTHLLAVNTRRKIIELKTTTTISNRWIKGHKSLKGNERADYLATTVASYNPNITYDAIIVSRRKQLRRTIKHKSGMQHI
jgi:ribonuclease HI